MKFQNKWRQKSIENLEKNNGGEIPWDESSIVQRAYRLRKLPLEALTTDDIRFMIIQEIGLPYMLSLAIEKLRDDLFAEGNYYKGDLLAAALATKPGNWDTCKELWSELNNLIKYRLDELRAYSPRLAIDNFYAAKLN